MNDLSAKPSVPSGGALVVPSQYRQDAVEVLLDQAVCGAALSEIARQPEMPSAVVLRGWLRDYPAVRRRYLEALAIYALEEARRVIGIADGSTRATLPLDRLRVDARRWLAEQFVSPLAASLVPQSHHNQLTNILIAVAQDGRSVLPTHSQPAEPAESESHEHHQRAHARSVGQLQSGGPPRLGGPDGRGAEHGGKGAGSV